MISRRTGKKIADFFHECFVNYRHSTYGGYTYTLANNKLYDFLYERDYEAWFLNLIQGLYSSSARSLKEFIMKLHTGESVVSVTADWDWKQREKLGQRHLKDLAEDILNGKHDTCYGRIRDELIADLELDGYSYKNNKLFFSEASILDEAEEEGILHNLVEKSDLSNQDIIFHHLKLSEEHYSDNKYDDSISNSRKFLESILQEIAMKHHLLLFKKEFPKDKYDKASEVRDYLYKNNLIEGKEKEAISSAYGLLSDTGSHPYIAKNDQARLLRNIALTYSQFVLLRFLGFKKGQLEENK